MDPEFLNTDPWHFQMSQQNLGSVLENKSGIAKCYIYKFYSTNSSKKSFSESFDTNLEHQKFAVFEGRLI